MTHICLGGGVCKVLVVRREGKRHIRGRWEYNVKRDLQEVDCKESNWMDLLKDTVSCPYRRVFSLPVRLNN